MQTVESELRESMAVYQAFLEKGGADLLREMARVIVAALRAGRRVYVCGNGGSAADAQHIAGELIGRFLQERAPLPCVALTTNTSILTALGNDYDFDIIFERQVNGLVEEGDILLALTTSGNSRNVLRAAAAATARGARVLGFSGHDGGKLLEAADLCLVAPSNRTPRIQELHIACAHVLCGLVERGCFG